MYLLQVIEETLSPTWDESMVFEEILVYGRREDIKANPPIIIVETYDQDKVRILKFISVTSLVGRFIRLEKQNFWEEPQRDRMSIWKRR